MSLLLVYLYSSVLRISIFQASTDFKLLVFYSHSIKPTWRSEIATIGPSRFPMTPPVCWTIIMMKSTGLRTLCRWSYLLRCCFITHPAQQLPLIQIFVASVCKPWRTLSISLSLSARPKSPRRTLTGHLGPAASVSLQKALGVRNRSCVAAELIERFTQLTLH